MLNFSDIIVTCFVYILAYFWLYSTAGEDIKNIDRGACIIATNNNKSNYTRNTYISITYIIDTWIKSAYIVNTFIEVIWVRSTFVRDIESKV